MSKYRYIGIPLALHGQIVKIVDEHSFGYRSPAEFVIDAIRRRLEEIMPHLNNPILQDSEKEALVVESP